MKNQTILISGGTGSFGHSFTEFLLINFNKEEIEKIIIFSRDEYKQFNLQKELNDKRLKFIIGDVRDLEALKKVTRGVDVVVHAAALKQIPILENNPLEGVKTNVLGSQNIIDASIENNVEKVLFVSSDKAVNPINLYGSTKLTAEKLFVQANALGKTKFGIVRYGNVMGSRGSVLEKFKKGEKIDNVKLTDPRMTRFWLTLDRSFSLVIFALDIMEGGEIFVPKIPSMKITDLFNALAPNIKQEVIGIRPGEKLHEVLINEYESSRAFEFNNCFIILPEIDTGKDYTKYNNKEKLPDGFIFASNTNDEWMTVQELKEII